MSAELAEYKAESKAIKNQDLTIRKQEEAIRELTAAVEAKDKELQDTRQQAAAEADAALLNKMQVWVCMRVQEAAGGRRQAAALGICARI